MVSAPVDVAGQIATIHVPDPQPALYRLTTWAAHEGHELAGLEALRPTLEDIFLEVTTRENGDE